MNDTTQNHEAEVIDLAALRQPAKRVVDIYDQLTNGQRPRPGILDEALSELDAVQQPPGQLGDDIALLTSGGVGATRESVVSAIERLRRISSLQPALAPRKTKRWKPRQRQRRTTKNNRQLQLPGIETSEEVAS